MRKLTICLVLIISLISITAPLHALSAERQLFNEAESRYQNGDLEFALNRYRDLLKEYPLSEYAPDAYFRIAVITFRSGKTEEAELLFNRVANRYMNTRFLNYLPFWKGLIKFNQGKWDEASLFLDNFLQKKPVSLIKEAYLYRARAEYSAGRADSALDILKEYYNFAPNEFGDPYLITFYLTLLEGAGEYEYVIRLFPNIAAGVFEEYWMHRLDLIHAESLYKSGKIEEAKIIYLKILIAEPEISSIGFIRMFSIYRDDIKKQTEIFDKAQVSLSGHPEMLNKFLLRVGIDSYNNGYFELAESYLWRIWRTSNIGNINALVPVYLSKILVLGGDRQEAIDLLSTYKSSVSVADELVLYTLSNVLIEDEQWKEAEFNLKNFLFTHPESIYYSSAAWMYAYSLYKSGQYAESLSVIDSVLVRGRGGANTTDFILLKARVFVKQGDTSNALAMFREYLPFDNENPEIWFDIIKLQFNSGDYSSAAATYRRYKDRSLTDHTNPVVLLIKYIAGLADIAEKRYKDGLEKLTDLDRDILKRANLENIFPYIAYYRGWASYRLSDFIEASRWFSLVAADFPQSSVSADALYFAGWSLYLSGKYSDAAEYFADFSNTAPVYEKAKGLFFYGKSVNAAGSLSEAEIIFQTIYKEYPASQYADDAIFEHGQILEKLNNYILAVSAYKELYKRYATSPLAEESLFKVGELYLMLGMYKEARDAFYLHRLKFPNGKLGDVSLYWGAESAVKMDERYGAILLWEKLLAEYPESSFRADALQKIAFSYAEEGEYRKALTFYSEFLAIYSDSASRSEVEAQIKKLNLLQSGVDEQEAELLVLIENEGTTSSRSREAYIELAKMYLYKYNGKEDAAFKLLSIVAALKNKNPDIAARAVYYLGDYYSIRKDYASAAGSFIEAATIYPENRDLMAVSLLRASEMAIAAGDRQTAEKMVRLLEINFPSSQWLQEGRDILRRGR